jgi:hypothetical protein
VGDVNGDGFEDLAITDGAAHDESVTRVYGGGAGGLGSDPLVTVMGAGRTGVGDADGDGLSDLGVVHRVEHGVYELHVHYGADGLADAPSQTLDALGGALPAANVLFGDADGDGYDDLATLVPVALGDPASTVLYRGGPTGLSSTPVVVSDGTDLDPLAFADVNGDGYDDLLFTRPQGPDIVVGVMLGGVAGPGTPLEVDRFSASLPSLDHRMAVGDWNGDGFDDAVVLGFTDGDDAVVWFGSATGLDAGTTGSLAGLPRHTIKKANRLDVTGDGIEDLVLGDYFGDQVLLYEGAPTGFGASPPEVLAAMVGEGFGSGVAFVDVDGDGGLELSVLSLDGVNTAGRLHVLPYQP